MPAVHGPWPRSVAWAIPVLVAVAAILAAADQLPRAIGVFGAVFSWTLVLPVSTARQLTWNRLLHPIVWITVFFPEPRWVFFALTTAATLGLGTLLRADRSGASFGSWSSVRGGQGDESAAFL